MSRLFVVINDKEQTTMDFFNSFTQHVYDDVLKVRNLMPDDKILIVFSQEAKVDQIKNTILNTKDRIQNNTVLFLAPHKLKNYFDNKDNCFCYPIKINELKKLVNQDTEKPITYKNLRLKNNFLINLNNLKQIKVSDTEKEILKLLFFKKDIKKELIKVSVLNYKSEIKSNTVESHLSRLRIKIEKTDSKLKIISNSKGSISLL